MTECFVLKTTTTMSSCSRCGSSYFGDFEVLTAEDGEKGCAMAISELPDIIFMDLETPALDGWEAARRLKGSPQTRDIPIIALSAHALAGEREKALAAGCNEFDTKPIEFDRLVATLRRILASPNCCCICSQSLMALVRHR
jgi:CheY-like chemotaxis protein